MEPKLNDQPLTDAELDEIESRAAKSKSIFDDEWPKSDAYVVILLARAHANYVTDVPRLVAKCRRLATAIRQHRDQRGDDRCWMDDEQLYAVLPEGYQPPQREVAVELELCKKFIACRRNPATVYVSPQREIERLQKALDYTQAQF